MFAVFLPVGPKPIERARVADTLECLDHYEPELRHIVMLNDSPDPERSLVPDWVRERNRFEVKVIHHPFHGINPGTYGGLHSGCLVCLDWAYQNLDPDFIIKIDTDAIVIRPFSAAVYEQMRKHANAGQLGSNRVTCNGPKQLPEGGPKYWYARHHLLRWRHRSVMPEVRLWGKPARLRKLMLRAMRNGYECGEACDGGSYACTRLWLKHMHDEGVFADAEFWLHETVSEDCVFTFWARYFGLDVVEMAGDGQPFGITWIGIPDTLERCVERGFSIIHSVKNDPRYSEDEIRAFCRARREAERAVPATS